MKGLVEGSGRFEARYVSPSHLRPHLEGGWVLSRIELPALDLAFDLAFDLADDLATWTVSVRR